MNREDQAELDCRLITATGERGDMSGQIRKLIEEGADRNAEDSWGRTPLIYAARMGNTDAVKLLISAGTDVNRKNFEGACPLSKAALYGHLDCIKLLLEAGADVNSADGDGWTAFMWAAGGVNIECMRVLIEAGADINMKNKGGETAGDVLKRREAGQHAKHMDELERFALFVKRLKDEDTKDTTSSGFEFDL